MVSSSSEQPARRRGETDRGTGRPRARVRMSRASASECAGARIAGPGGAPSGAPARWRRLASRLLQIGTGDIVAVDLNKRIRLCNLLALWGTVIMAPWVAFE